MAYVIIPPNHCRDEASMALMIEAYKDEGFQRVHADLVLDPSGAPSESVLLVDLRPILKMFGERSGDFDLPPPTDSGSGFRILEQIQPHYDINDGAASPPEVDGE